MASARVRNGMVRTAWTKGSSAADRSPWTAIHAASSARADSGS